MTQPGGVVKSTSDLVPDGILGYAKTIVAIATGVLVAVVPFLPDGDYQRYAQIVLAALGVVGVYLVPNAVKPVDVAPLPVTYKPDLSAPIPPSVLAEPPITDPAPVLGVVDPPGRHEQL